VVGTGGAAVGDELAVDEVGQPPLQAAHGFQAALALEVLAPEVRPAGGVVAQLHHGADVRDVVEPPVPARDSRWRTCSPEEASIGGGAGPGREARWWGSGHVTDVGQDPGRPGRADAGPVHQVRPAGAHGSGQLGF